MKRDIILFIGLFFLVFFGTSYASTNTDALPPLKLSDIHFPPQDQPTPQEVEKIKTDDKSSTDYYYPPNADYDKARKHAFVEMGHEDEYCPMGAGGSHFMTGTPYYACGRGVLIMIYANGKGVPQNIDLALQIARTENGYDPTKIYASADSFSLESEVDPTIEEIVRKLLDMKNKTSTSPLDLCNLDSLGQDEINSCADVETRMANEKRLTKIKAITDTWTDAQKKSLQQLLTVADDFYTQRYNVEELDDDCGSMAPMRVYISVDHSREAFAKILKNFEAGHLPPTTTEQAFSQIDTNLNSIYQESRATLKQQRIVEKNLSKKLDREHRSSGTCDATLPSLKDFQTYEQMWIKYRDAWVNFGITRYPDTSAASWKAWITQKHIQDLKEFKKNIRAFVEQEGAGD